MKIAENVEVDLGDSVELTCEIDSNPLPTVLWMKDGSTEILSSDNTLRLRNIGEEDIGAYQCKGQVIGFSNAVHTTYVLKKGETLTCKLGNSKLNCRETCVIQPEGS